MSDFLHFQDNNSKTRYACSMFAHRFVCFFPKEGFAIFEGYCHLKPEELPYSDVLAYRRNSFNSKDAGLFNLCITDVIRKVVEPPSWKLKTPCSEDCGDDCECNIRFFPCDIIILKFEAKGVNKQDDEKEWSFCIDRRFNSPNALLERYMALIDDPGFYGNGYMPREEDQPFYDEFHRIIQQG